MSRRSGSLESVCGVEVPTDFSDYPSSLTSSTAKAVELFLQDMVLAMEKEARQKGTRKVNLHHV